jgi:RimK family alpha-L-glutamate ligase
LEKANYRLFNRADFIKICDDKMLTFIECANKGIRMPKTIAGPLVYTDLAESNFLFLDKVIEELSLPMIVKRVYGSLGEGVYLVKTKEELVNLYKDIAQSPIIFQEYVDTSYGKSIRVLIIDGKVFGSFIRKNNADFRSNFSDTASSQILTNPEKYEAFAQKIADKLHIEYAGIDLLVYKDEEPILCEINSNAFFEEFEKVTHLDVAKAVMDMVVRKVNNHE